MNLNSDKHIFCVAVFQQLEHNPDKLLPLLSEGI
jgi:hypothetical protein